MKNLLVIFSALLLMAGCTKEESPEPEGESQSDSTVVPTLSLSHPTVALEIGDTLQLGFQVTPASRAANISLQWSSDDESIVTVSPDGLLTAIAIGETRIVAASTDGELTAEAHVRVNPVALTGISFEKRYLAAYLDERIRLEVNYAPANATDTVLLWNSYNTDVITLEQSGHVTPKKFGYALVTATKGNMEAACFVIPALRGREVSGAYVSAVNVVVNPKEYYWEVCLANTGSEVVKVEEVTLLTSSSLTEEAARYTEAKTLQPGTADRIARIALTEAYFNGLSMYSLVRMKALIGVRPVYILIGKDNDTRIVDR